jgi:hypothetical protein
MIRLIALINHEVVSVLLIRLKTVSFSDMVLTTLILLVAPTGCAEEKENIGVDTH